ncbi:hypothetical protein BGW41_005649 [Actinomortierella wolfii]|nr:hypothetical protein BGW41_005649 [Actinomortierella wolfii]
MPSVTLHNPEDKAAIKRALPTSTQKIITATVARLYVAYPDSQTWTYSNIMGGLAFVQTKNTFLFRIVDLMGSRGVIWEQELYEGFEYNQERSFFHTFATDNYLAAFSFADEQEASVFYKKVSNRGTLKKVKSGSPSPKSKKGGLFGSVKEKKGHKGKLDKSQIGLPSNFRHLSHIGWDPNKGFNVQNIDPEWKNLFEQLEKMGVSQEDINNNAEFVTQFVQARGGPAAAVKKPTPAPTPAPPPAPSRPVTQHRPAASTSAPPTPLRPTSKAPPPPPPASRRAPPPPPPSRMSRAVPAPPPPAPAAPPAPPALPSREPAAAPESPRPPPTPARSSDPAPPPPPPRPATVSSSAPPPPPPPIRGAYVPAVSTPPPPPPPPAFHSPSSSSSTPPPPPPPFRPTAGGGGPPPPPPPPPVSGGRGGAPPPPPPPPVPAGGAGGPPPPPPPPPSGGGPALPPGTKTDGRQDLLASIRNAGGIGSLRKTGMGDPRPYSAPSSQAGTVAGAAAGAAAGGAAYAAYDEASSGSGGGGGDSSGDLASALAAALQMRKSRVAGSDDEESDDESWDD